MGVSHNGPFAQAPGAHDIKHQETDDDEPSLWDVKAQMERMESHAPEVVEGVDHSSKVAGSFLGGALGEVGEFVSSGLGLADLGYFGPSELAEGFNESDPAKMLDGTFTMGKGAFEAYSMFSAAENAIAMGGEGGALLTGAEASGELGEAGSMAAAESFTEGIPIVGQVIAAFLGGSEVGKALDGPQSEGMRASSGGFSGKELAQRTGETIDSAVAPVLGPDNAAMVGATASAATRLASFTGVDMGAASAAGRYMQAQDMAKAKADRERMAKDTVQVPHALVQDHSKDAEKIARLKKRMQEEEDANEIQMPNVDFSKTRPYPPAATVHQHYAE